MFAAKSTRLIESHAGKTPAERFLTTPLFWDCECQAGYIHPAVEAECSVCEAQRDESPDSRVDEINRHRDELPLGLVALVNLLMEVNDVCNPALPVP